MLAKKAFLRYRDPEEQLEIQCYKNDNGLSAALLQNGQPIAHSSCALTETKCYASTEKEMLSHH